MCVCVCMLLLQAVHINFNNTQLFICSNVFRLDVSEAPSSVVSRLTRNLIRSSSLLSDHSDDIELPIPVQQWLDQYSSWCNEWKIKSLDVLLARHVIFGVCCM